MAVIKVCNSQTVFAVVVMFLLYFSDIMLPHPAHGTSTLRYTANYIWSTADVLGQGATGFVFKGRERVSLI